MRPLMARAFLLLVLLTSTPAFAGLPPVGLKDEGGTETKPVFTINCVGAGISCGHSGTTATITVGGGGGATIVVEEDNSTVDSDVTNLDFLGADFDVTSSPSGEANVVVAAALTRDAEWDTESEVQTAWGSVNILLETEIDASSELKALMDDETGSGLLVFATSPALTTPTVGNGSTGPGSVDFLEDSDNGTNKITVVGVSSVSSDKTLTLPDATDTLVGKATTDTLTNKTLTAADNVIGADTAVALAANGGDCSAGSAPIGVDASGAAESCTAYQPLESTLTDIADGTIAENLVNTANPWADNEVADDVTAGQASSLGADGVDALTEIAQSIKSAADDTSKLVVGTPGSTNDCAKWDANGALVSAGAACGSGGGGDSVSIDGAGVTDPDFVSTGQIDFVDTSNTVTANINDNSILEADLKAVDSATDEDILTYESTTGDFEWHTEDEIIATMSAGGLPNDSVLEADLKAVDAASDEECLTYETTTGDFEWQACGSGSGTTEYIFPIYSAKITGTFALDGDATQGAQIDAGDGNWRLLFDATTDEGAVWQGIVPENFASVGVVDIDFSMTSGEASEVQFEAAIMCYTPGTDTADVGTASFATLGEGSATTVSATAGEVYRQSVTLTDDSCAAGDDFWIYVSTDADDATNDDATGDREVIGVKWNYA